MTRAFAVAALAGLFAAASAQDGQTYKLRLKPEAKGDRVKVASDEVADMRVVLDVGGNKLDKGEKKTTKEAYTEEILAKPADAKKPTKLTRAYTAASVAKAGETTDYPYRGKTVLIEKKGDKYTFTVGGKELDEDDADQLNEEFNKENDVPLENQDFLPEKPVKVNETWTVDPDKIVKGFEAGAPFTLLKDKTKVTGKLVKAYTKDGRQFGVIELDLTLGVKMLKLEGEEIPAKAGSKITGKMTLDACIDGTSHTGSEKGDLSFNLTGEVPNGTIAITGTVKMTKTTEDLAAR